MSVEKSRQCTGCGERVALSAKFCEFCGQRQDAVALNTSSKAKAKVKAAPEFPPIAADPGDGSSRYLDEFDSRESARLSREYFEAHAELLKNHRKQLKVMARTLDESERALNEIGRGQLSGRRTREIQAALEAVESLGENWEDLQLGYNRESEALDEEFQDRFAEMELDVELPEDLQDSMARELEVITRSFDRIGERIGTLGTLGNEMIARAEGRYFGAENSRRALLLLTSGSALGWLGTLTWLWLGQGFEPLTAALVSSPALLMPITVVMAFK